MEPAARSISCRPGPETVQSRGGRSIERFTLKSRSRVLAEGRSIGQRIGAGRARVIRGCRGNGARAARRRAGRGHDRSGLGTGHEARGRHRHQPRRPHLPRRHHRARAGHPARWWAAARRPTAVKDGQEVTVSCAEGDTGFVYEGVLGIEEKQIQLDSMPPAPVKIMMNVGNPDRAFAFAALPHHGVGLARLEFIINRMIGVHPRALLEFDELDVELQAQIRQQIAGYADPTSFFIDKLSEGISQIAAAFAPQPVIVRLSDFKSNEYANLIGGRAYEPHEENPMLGFRGAARYIDEAFRPCFELECRALRRVREEMGLTNVQVMVPFVRTLTEAGRSPNCWPPTACKRGENDLKLIMMCELPTNAVLADKYLEFFDGMSIGSNDMTQLTLGLDRDSAVVAKLVRRTRRGGQGHAGHGHHGLQTTEQVCRHLRPGPFRSPGTGPLAGGSGHRQPFAEPRHGGGDLDVPGRREDLSGSPMRTICFVSDRTGVTAETMGHSLLSQFEGLQFRSVTMPFVSSVEQAKGVVRRINTIAQEEGARPIIFCTLVDDQMRATVKQANGLFLDFFAAFLGPLETELQMESAHASGRALHGSSSDPDLHGAHQCGQLCARQR